MPYSMPDGKLESEQWIARTFAKDAQVLDVGPGAGAYADMLDRLAMPGKDAVEGEARYVRQFRLGRKYREVFVADVRQFEPARHYDLVIFGDVLEHMPEADALAVLDKFSRSHRLCSVPFMWRQGALEGVELERHWQDTLTPESVDAVYAPSLWLHRGETIGVFVIAPSA